MTLTSRYMTTSKNIPAIFKKIREGVPPEKFTVAHLKSIGFKSSNDQGIIPVLKDLGFLTSDGAPTKRYSEYRDESKHQQVMGEAIKEAYQDLFHINENPSDSDRKAILGKFKSTHGSTDNVAARQASTFLALLQLADLKSAAKAEAAKLAADDPAAEVPPPPPTSSTSSPKGGGTSLHYNIQIHLPATKDVDVFNAIFRSLKEHILD